MDNHALFTMTRVDLERCKKYLNSSVLSATILVAMIGFLSIADAVTSGPSSNVMAGNPSNSTYLFGPFGWIPSNCIYQIPKNSKILGGSNGWDIVLTHNGTEIQIPPCVQPRLTTSSQSLSSIVRPSFSAETGTIIYADWTYRTTNPPAIFYFHGHWQVPQAPSSHDNQQIFFVMGLAVGQGGNPHVSAGINWGGDGCAGGGTFWMESVWAIDANGHEYCTPYLTISAGDGITVNDDSISCTSDGACDWQPSIQDTTSGYGNSIYCSSACHAAMQYSGIDLTVGNVVNCNDYPASSTTFTSLQLANTNFNYITPSWTPHTVTGDGCGESITNLSSSGMTFNYHITNQPPLSLAISASPTSIPAGGLSTSTITASLSDGSSGVVVTLSTTKGTLSSTSCTTGTGGSCSVTLTSSLTAGAATVTGNASNYGSASTSVTLTGTTLSNSCCSDWTKINGNWITSQSGYLDGSGYYPEIRSTNTFASSRTVTARMLTVVAGSHNYDVAYLRGKWVDDNNKVVMYLTTDGYLEIDAKLSGTWYYYPNVHTGANPLVFHTFNMVFSGSQVQGYLDGQLYITLNNSVIGSFGSADVSGYVGNGLEMQLDGVTVS